MGPGRDDGASAGGGGDGPDGLRTAKTVDGTTTEYTWDTADGLPLLLSQHHGTTTTEIVYGPGGTPLYEVTGTTVTYYHQDHQGSTRLTTDATGAPIARYAYSAYGELTTNTAPTAPTPVLGYTGQYTDPETGYIYLRARYLDPTTGQFTTRDPIVSFTREPYRYVSANPVNGADPTGLCGPFGDGPCTPGGVAEDIREGLGICSDYVDEDCETVAEEHPEAAQAGADFAGGVLEVNPVTAFLPLDLEGHGVNTDSDAFRAGEVSMFIADLALGASAAKASCTKQGFRLWGTTFIRMHVDDAPHRFSNGRKIGRHLQFNTFTKGKKGSGHALRIPIGSVFKDLF